MSSPVQQQTRVQAEEGPSRRARQESAGEASEEAPEEVEEAHPEPFPL